jgi:tetratricopeptide (TPR) repeat protein
MKTVLGIRDLGPYLERLIRFIWRRHYHVPRVGYGLMLVASGLTLWVALLVENAYIAIAAGVLLFLGAQGFTRWAVESRNRPALIVPLFGSGRDETEKARETQRVIVSTLADNLAAFPSITVVAIPEVVGNADRNFAARLRARLRAEYLLHGDIRVRADGTTSVYARLLKPDPRYLVHVDPFTQDVLWERTLWRAIYLRLTPTTEVQDVEYPFEFASELEGIMRALEAELAVAASEVEHAERLYRDALGVAPASESHAVDEIRCSLAWTLWLQGKKDQAIEFLEERAQQASASPAVLRQLASFLAFPLSGPFQASDRDFSQSIDLLRRAADQTQDTLRDMTLYNLANALASTPETIDEAHEIEARLLRTRGSHYRRAWYLMRQEGSWHWHRALQLSERGQEADAQRAFAVAATWYSKSIWRRPRFQPQRMGRRLRWLRLRRILVPPKMLANAADAHGESGHRLRARLYLIAEARTQRRIIRKANELFTNGDPEKALETLGWARVGRADDAELHLLVFASLLAHILGDETLVNRTWNQAIAIDQAHAVEVRSTITESLLDSMGIQSDD